MSLKDFADGNLTPYEVDYNDGFIVSFVEDGVFDKTVLSLEGGEDDWIEIYKDDSEVYQTHTFSYRFKTVDEYVELYYIFNMVDSNNYYSLLITDDYDDQPIRTFELFKRVSGSTTKLATFYYFRTHKPQTASIEHRDDGITVCIDGYKAIDVPDSDISVAGVSGFWAYTYPSGEVLISYVEQSETLDCNLLEEEILETSFDDEVLFPYIIRSVWKGTLNFIDDNVFNEKVLQFLSTDWVGGLELLKDDIGEIESHEFEYRVFNNVDLSKVEYYFNRSLPPTNDYYRLNIFTEYYDDDNSVLGLYKIYDGSGTQLGSDISIPNDNEIHKVRIERVETSIKVYFDDDLVIDVTDEDITTSERSGFEFFGFESDFDFRVAYIEQETKDPDQVISLEHSAGISLSLPEPVHIGPPKDDEIDLDETASLEMSMNVPFICISDVCPPSSALIMEAPAPTIFCHLDATHDLWEGEYTTYPSYLRFKTQEQYKTSLTINRLVENRYPTKLTIQPLSEQFKTTLRIIEADKQAFKTILRIKPRINRIIEYDTTRFKTGFTVTPAVSELFLTRLTIGKYHKRIRLKGKIIN